MPVPCKCRGNQFVCVCVSSCLYVKIELRISHPAALAVFLNSFSFSAAHYYSFLPKTKNPHIYTHRQVSTTHTPSTMPPPPPPLPLSLRLHQKLLTLTLTPNQINQELKHQLISPFTLPLLRRALRKHTPTLPQLEQFLRPVLVPEEHAAGLASWYNDARFQAFVRKEYLQRKVVSDGVGGNVSGADRAKIKGGVRERTKYARTVQERKEEEGDKATTSPSVDIHTHTHTHTTPPWLSSDTDQDKDKPPRLPTHQEVIDFFHLHSWNRHLHPSTKSHTHTHTHPPRSRGQRRRPPSLFIREIGKRRAGRLLMVAR